MNVKLLKQVRDYIAKHPEKYDQGHFCGTACCIAGTAAFLSGKVTRKWLAEKADADDTYDASTFVEGVGAKVLGLTEGSALRLFSPNWSALSDEFRIDYQSDTAAQQAKKAARRINHFIKTRGAE